MALRGAPRKSSYASTLESCYSGAGSFRFSETQERRVEELKNSLQRVVSKATGRKVTAGIISKS